MANPFLVLGGIAVGIITATFGILQVPGWVAQAQDASAINDLSMISAAQAASASLTGKYAHDIAALQSGDLGLTFTIPDTRVQRFAADADGWCAVALSDSGRYFAASDTVTISKGASTPEGAAGAACDVIPPAEEGTGEELPPAVEPPAEEVPPAEVPPAEVPPVTEPPVEAAKDIEVLTYTVRSGTSVPFTLALENPEGTITWNDNVVQRADGSGAVPSRTLAANVTYQVTFEGEVDGFAHIVTPEQKASQAAVRSMDKWTSSDGVTSGARAFQLMTNITDVPASTPTFTDMTRTFESARVLNDADISNWDTSHVTKMDSVFLNAVAFNRDLSQWKTGKVTSMTNAFQSAAAFNQNISGWDTSQVAAMDSMFYYATNFSQNLSGWNVDKVTSYASFRAMSKITTAQMPKF